MKNSLRNKVEGRAMPIERKYSHELRHQYGFFPVWPPGDAIEPGQVGTLRDGVFRKETTLKRFLPACPYSPSRPVNMDRPFQYSSKDIKKLGIQATADLQGMATVKLNAQFGSSGGVIFEATGIRRLGIEDLAEIRRFIQSNRSTWPREYVLVGSVDTADSFRVLISEAANGTLTLSGNADAIENLHVADASLSVGADSQIGYQTPRGNGAIFANVYGFSGLFGRTFELLGPKPEGEFVEVSVEDWDDIC
jgi:hypothetical protein